MAKPKLPSLIVFGVDVGPEVGQMGQNDVGPMAERLLDRLRRRQFRATWCFQELETPLARRIHQAAFGQEIALDLATAGSQLATDCFAQAARLRDWRRRGDELGLNLSSLVVDPNHGVSVAAIAQAGFNTVRPGGHMARRTIQPVHPQCLRYGLWALPVSFLWPHPHRLTQRFAATQVTFHLRRTVRQGAAMHVVFDLPGLCRLGVPALAGIERLLDAAAQLRDLGALHAARLVDLHQLARVETIARPTQSILRRSA